MKTVEEARRRWKTLLDYGRNIDDLKEATGSNDSGNPCESGLRSICWKIFLLCDGLERSKWAGRISDTRSAYVSLKDHFLKYIQHPNDLQSTVDPLAEDEESPWRALRQDEAARAEICQDVERCLQDNRFFREQSTKSMMLDILFIYSKLNPDLGYRQGMHELLAPILWVVERDAVAVQSPKSSTVGAVTEDSLMLELLDATYVESDSFNIFCSVMQVARSFYEHSDNKSVSGRAEMAPIVIRSHFIHNELLMAADHELAAHLNTIDILPQIFLTRWIRLLFGREFPFDDTLLIWDLIFANGLRSTLIDHICVAMLLRIRWQLLETDYSSALTLLLRYPASNEHSARSIVHDGLYLEQNLNPARGAFLISKYSGRPPELAQQSAQPQSRDLSPRKDHRRHSRDLSAGSLSGHSPARNSQRTLESLFQEVSEGLQRRTENWGVAKAVRGAVSEAKRNMANAEAGSFSASRVRRVALRSEPSQLESSRSTDPVDLVKQVAALKKRDTNLAELLSDAMSDMSVIKNSSGELPATITEALDRAFQRIKEVHADLQTSSGINMTPSPPIPLQNEKETSDNFEITEEKNEEQQPMQQGQSQLSPDDKSKEVETQPELPNEANTKSMKIESPSSLDAVPTAAPSSSQLPKSQTRRPLAQSEFSWMLGENTHRWKFVSSASPPPDQSRRSESRSRQGSLFGDSRDEKREASQHDEDSLSLNSFS